MMQNEGVINQEETVTFLDVIRVLFGRKLILLIVTLGVAFVGSIGAFIYNNVNLSFSSNFVFSENCLNGNEASNLNDTDFRIRDYFNKEALMSYKESNSELSELDVDKIILKNGIEEPKWTVVEEYNKEANINKIVKEDYKIVFNKKFISSKQAKSVMVAATNKIVSDNIKLLKELDRDEYIELYKSAILFDDKVSCLEKEFDYILSKYDLLIDRFGNVKAIEGNPLLIADYRNEVQSEYQNISFEGLYKEINNKALVYDKDQTISLLLAKIDDINLELKYANDEKADLVAQRNAIIAASDGKFTLDLNSYNTKIVELTEKIYNLEKEKEIVNKKISIINTTNALERAENEAYVTAFNEKLEVLSNKLETFADDLGKIEVYQYETNMKVYFDTSAVIKTVDKIDVLRFAIISLFVGFLASLITNLCLDGKKLTKEYKKEQEAK